MKSTNVSTAAASGGVAGAAVVIICWALSLAHVVVPAEVAASFMVVTAPVLHLVALRMGVEPAPVAPTPTNPPTAPVTAAPAIPVSTAA
jgi:multisubunit Na+/H+ antiporter MnhG subunit